MPSHVIPKAVDPLAIYWLQPTREALAVDDVFAKMGPSAFKMLSTHSNRPSEVYAGKMWKRHYGNDVYYLCWYGPASTNNGQTVVHQRRIILK